MMRKIHRNCYLSKVHTVQVHDQGISGSQKSILIGFTGTPNTDSCLMAVITGNVLH